MMLLTKANRRALPGLYSQDGKGQGAIAEVKFFLEGWTWYASEFDGSDTFFGLVVSTLCPEGELGYFTLSELSKVRGRFSGVERDRHFRTKALAECQRLG